MKIIQMPHKVCPMTCMVNGLEDLYEKETSTRLPDQLLLYLSGLLGFVYLKNKNAPTQHMVFWGSNLAKYQYHALADIVGYEWEMVSNRSFPFTLNKVKGNIDQDTPAIIGVLDMYHLPYYDKFYHKFHIPIHYVLMVGYDDEHQAAYVLDCDRADVQVVPYRDLELAWNVNIPGLGKKNTYYTFDFNREIADIETIARKGLIKRSSEMLHPPASIFGIRAMRKLITELPKWPEMLSPKQLDICLRHLVEFTGKPPVPPNRLTGIYDAPDNHGAGRDDFAELLRQLNRDYHETPWLEAADLFDESAQALKEFTDLVVDIILGNGPRLNQAAKTLETITDLEERAFKLIGEI